MENSSDCIQAEKPSVGRAVAAVLPQPHQQGGIKVANGDVVTWCINLLEQAEPEAYNPGIKVAQEHLPIIPTQWQHQVKPATRKQLTVVKADKQADVLVNMGDPDRVGQILVDEVINYSGVSKAKRMPLSSGSDMNPDAIDAHSMICVGVYPAGHFRAGACARRLVVWHQHDPAVHLAGPSIRLSGRALCRTCTNPHPRPSRASRYRD